MARSGLYKTDVQRARDALLAQGKRPSVDAVRVALGNTGSKTTIHRYLRELEEEEGQGPGTHMAISQALQDLVGRLAARLQEEADAIVAQARQRHETQLQETQQALSGIQQEAAALRQQLQRTETGLHEERAAHAALQQAFADQLTAIAQLNERVAGMTARLAEHEAHAQSLEDKHAHAREALEHYRTSVKEQREQEQRRHEHQVQELQLALRQANEALGTKNQELLHLNRDNSQWLERYARLERDLQQLQRLQDSQQGELDTLRQTAVDHQGLQARWASDTRTLETLRNDLASAQALASQERQRREQAEAQALRAAGRLEALELLLAKLTPAQPAAKKSRPVSSQENDPQ